MKEDSKMPINIKMKPGFMYWDYHKRFKFEVLFLHLVLFKHQEKQTQESR